MMATVINAGVAGTIGGLVKRDYAAFARRNQEFDSPILHQV